jgi:Uma2 family endonuclease
MSTTMRKPRMTREQFLDWVETQDGRWEFDGFEPVAMTGGTRNHERICQNIYFALRSRLRGGPCEVLGATAGIAVGEAAVRYPDALVTCTPGPGTARVMPGPVVVFEVISPTSGRVDRIAKLREYQRVESIRRYVILESTSVGLTVHARRDGDGPWTTMALTEGEALPLPEIDIEVPVAEFYEGVAFEEADEA